MSVFPNKPPVLSPAPRSVPGFEVRATGLARWWLLASLIAAPLSVLQAADGRAEPAAARSNAGQVTPAMTLGVGDVVRVEVFGRPELTLTAPVAGDGSIPMALAGDIRVAGSTQSKAAQSIAAAFRQQELLVNPQVTVFLVESSRQKVSVLGAVARPGVFTLGTDGSVFDVLAQAGGIGENGASTIIVMRPDAEGQIVRHSVDLYGRDDPAMDAQALTLRGGDAILVPAAERFTIYGEVNQPNIYRLDPGMTVVEAISRGGGVTPRGSRNRVEIRSTNADGSFSTRAVTLDDAVEPDDVIRIKGRIF